MKIHLISSVILGSLSLVIAQENFNSKGAVKGLRYFMMRTPESQRLLMWLIYRISLLSGNITCFWVPNYLKLI